MPGFKLFAKFSSSDPQRHKRHSHENGDVESDKASKTGQSPVPLTVPVVVVEDRSIHKPDSVPGKPAESSLTNDNIAQKLQDLRSKVSGSPAVPPPALSDEEILTGISNSVQAVSKSPKIMGSTIVGDTASLLAGDPGVGALVATTVKNTQGIFKEVIGNMAPGLINTLGFISQSHPFLAVVYGAFKLMYEESVKYNDNDRKRLQLFDHIMKTMSILLELGDIKKDDPRVIPDGGQIAVVCKDMAGDIQECWILVRTQQKRSFLVRYLSATKWNEELAQFIIRFQDRAQELQVALQLHTVRALRRLEDKQDRTNRLLATLTSMLSPSERELEKWIQEKGGQDKVLKDDKLCRDLLLQEERLTRGSYNPSPADSPTELREFVSEEVKTAVRRGAEESRRAFQLGLRQAQDELTKRIELSSERVISVLSDGPHNHIKNPIIAEVWKAQGWKASAQTRPFVLALRDYLIEQAQAAHDSFLVNVRDTEVVDTNREYEWLQDSWIVNYLEPKHLRYIEEALDTDSSGWVNIAEIDKFISSCPDGWSLQKWLSYWAIGWNLHATKKCDEIDELLQQMYLVRDKIGRKMPGNKRCVSRYLEETWRCVTALTSSIEKAYDPWLISKYEEYFISNEKAIEERLKTVNYEIGALGTVRLILEGENIERILFTLLASVLRRHLAKIHCFCDKEIPENELDSETGTIQWIVHAVHQRYLSLIDVFRHQQVPDLKQAFDLFSFGLFKKYWDWGGAWTDYRYFANTDIFNLYPPVELKTLESLGVPPAEITTNPLSTDYEEEKSTGSSGTLREAITGTWFGFEWQDWSKPIAPMMCIRLRIADTESDDTSTELPLTGKSFDEQGYSYTSPGTISRSPETSIVTVQFDRVYDVRWYCYIQYVGTLDLDRGIISGTYRVTYNEGTVVPGEFLIKRLASAHVMCHRPLKVKLTPRELWQFAYDCALEGIRQHRSNGREYLVKRVLDIKQLLLALHASSEGREVDPQEWGKLMQSFTPDGYRLAWFWKGWCSRASDMLLTYVCDVCSRPTGRSRVMCLDCNGTDSVDFCSDLNDDCINSTTLRASRDDASHETTHHLLKARDRMPLKELQTTRARALAAYRNAENIYEPEKAEDDGSEVASDNDEAEAEDTSEVASDNDKAEAEDDESEVASDNDEAEEEVRSQELAGSVSDEYEEDIDQPRPFCCLVCQDRVKTPCWYCIDCQDVDSRQRFLCIECERKTDNLYPWEFLHMYQEQLRTGQTHDVYHGLVRIRDLEEEKAAKDDGWITVQRSTEKKLIELEENVKSQLLEVQQSINDRLSALEKRLDSTLARLERLVPAQN